MNDKPTLDNLAGLPQYMAEVGGRTYQFSELTLAALSRLQAWIKATVPHPVDAIKPHLDGLSPDERKMLITEAAARGLSWPPRIGSQEAAGLLLGSQDGQIQVLLEGLKIHEPNAVLADAERLYFDLNREVKRRRSKGLEPEEKVARIYGVLFGTYDPDEDDGPKG